MLNKGLKYTLSFLVLIFIINFSSLSASAAEYTYEDEINAQTSSSTFVRRNVSYSKNTYCEFKSCPDQSKKPLPQQIWVSLSGGYAGYISIEKFYISATHIVVTYSGNIPKAPYVPTSIHEDEDK